MDETDELSPKHYDRHAADWAAPQPPGRRFFAWVDAIGIFLPIWLVLLSLGIGTPLVWLIHGAHARGHYALGVAAYGGLFVFFIIVPYAIAYCVWRIGGVIFGVAPIFLTALYGIAASLAWIAVRGDINAPAALLLYPCVVGVVACSVQWLAAIGGRPLG